MEGDDDDGACESLTQFLAEFHTLQKKSNIGTNLVLYGSNIRKYSRAPVNNKIVHGSEIENYK